MSSETLANHSGLSRRAVLTGAAAGMTAFLALPKSLRAQDVSTLRVAVTDLTGEILDPMMEVRSQALNINLIMFDSILEIGPANELVPGLAESWEVDDEGTVWSFKLREGVEFHGGYGEVTAEDAVYSMERWMHPDVASSAAAPLRQAVESVTATGKYTFEVRTNGRRPTFPYLLSPHETVTGIVLSKTQLLEAGEDFQAQTRLLNERPIGSGAYAFESRQRGRSLTVAAVDNHWRVNPEIRRIEFLIVPDLSTQYLMLQSGEIDMMQPSPDQAAQAEAADGISVYTIANSSDYAINVYGAHEEPALSLPTSDPRVRKAISLAIDRQTIIDSIMGGYAGNPIAPWGLARAADGVVAEGLQPWLDEVATYDPEQAKALLAEAGYPDGFTIAMRDSTRTVYFPNPAEVSLAIAAQLAAIGIRIEYTTQEYTTLRPYLVESQADPYISGQLVPSPGTARFTAEAHLRIFFTQGGATRLLNDDTFDELVTQLGSAMDPADREEFAMEAIRIMADSWVSIPVLSAGTLYAASDRVVGAWHERSDWPYLSRQIELLKLAT
jgi:peptide/nickel transport system substrate-binding protein